MVRNGKCTIKIDTRYLSLNFSDGTSLLFILYEYKYCRKCTDMYDFYPRQFNVQMLVSVLSSFAVLLQE